MFSAKKMSFENIFILLENAIKAQPKGTLNNTLANLTDENKKEYLELMKSIFMTQFGSETEELIDKLFPKMLEELAKTDLSEGNFMNNLISLIDKMTSSLISPSVSVVQEKSFDEYVENYFTEYDKLDHTSKTICFLEVGSFYEAYSTNTRGPNLVDIGPKLNIILTNKSSDPTLPINEKNPNILSFPKLMVNHYLNILNDWGYETIFLKDDHSLVEPLKELNMKKEDFECKNCFSRDSNEPIILPCNHIICKKCADEKLECNVCNENLTIYI